MGIFFQLYNEMNSIFLVTKPIQYFNVTNIEDNNRKICIIINLFYNAERIYEEIKSKSDYWDEVYFFYFWKDAFKYIESNKMNVSNLYLDSDFGFQKNMHLRRLRSMNIFVYEEGVGSYKPYFRKRTVINYVINSLSRLCGFQNYLGGSKYTKGIYLYDISLHQKNSPHCLKERHTFLYQFREYLNIFKDKAIVLPSNFGNIMKMIRGNKVLIYLTSWNIAPEIEKILNNYPDYIKVLKPHPHLLNKIEKQSSMFDIVLPGNTLIEFFIDEALKHGCDLLIIHHGSSALMYFKNEEHIKTFMIK